MYPTHLNIFFSFLCFFQVTVGSQSANGTGPNKKLAKRAAAESLLQMMGYSRPVTAGLSIAQPAKPALKATTTVTEAATADGEKTADEPPEGEAVPATAVAAVDASTKGKKVGAWVYLIEC